MTREEIIRMAREAGISESHAQGMQGFLERFFQAAYAAGAAAERERICKAIKEEDDYCVTEGDYMLDSNDCIAVAKSKWVRPDYSAGAIRARS